MINRPVIIAVICVGFFLIVETYIPKTMALRTSSINDFTMENERTDKQNYMMRRGRDKEILGSLDNLAAGYEVEASDLARNPEDLSAFIVDYANMIDDVVFDKSVETRTRKRGNIKLEKYSDQSISDPCNCKPSVLMAPLGDNTFPRHVLTKVCGKEHGCDTPYICKEISYDMAVLRKINSNSVLNRKLLIPGNLSLHWAVEYEPINVGCQCIRDYIL